MYMWLLNQLINCIEFITTILHCLSKCCKCSSEPMSPGANVDAPFRLVRTFVTRDREEISDGRIIWPCSSSEMKLQSEGAPYQTLIHHSSSGHDGVERTRWGHRKKKETFNPCILHRLRLRAHYGDQILPSGSPDPGGKSQKYWTEEKIRVKESFSDYWFWFLVHDLIFWEKSLTWHFTLRSYLIQLEQSFRDPVESPLFLKWSFKTFFVVFCNESSNGSYLIIKWCLILPQREWIGLIKPTKSFGIEVFSNKFLRGAPFVNNFIVFHACWSHYIDDLMILNIPNRLHALS